ncbi:TonB-dependent receptor [uncultured Parvibaculum sp.]|uniref:TonB-dependent receptor domain-containing protein n=1 Tax=uncultured Parvibaculum sp. TaxID=291828 RepID=UPI0030D702E6
MSLAHFSAGRRAALRAAAAPAALAIAFAVPATHARAEEPASRPIVIEGDQALPGPLERMTPADTNGPAPRDAGEFLSRLEGVTSGRLGGHGNEISMRGLTQDNIAVISDGAYVFGGCPNRMDPPSSLSALLPDDVVTVARGYQSVTDGPPAPGGTVTIDRADPYDIADGLSGGIEGGIESNGETRYVSAQARAGLGGAYVRGFANAKKAGNYEDGDGRDVRSAFKQYGGGLEAGWRYGNHSVVSLSSDVDIVEDALFAGAGMDSPWTAARTVKASLDHNFDEGSLVTTLEVSAYGSFVEHLMDNYSLRTPGMMRMRTDANSDTYGGRLAAGLDVIGGVLTLGVDHRTNNRNAESRSNMMGGAPVTITNYTWPDMFIRDTGLFGEYEAPVDAGTSLKLGLRADFVSVEAKRADWLPGGMGAITARQLYATYYGVTDTDREETNVSALARVTHDFNDSISGWIGAARAVRTADATERGIVRNGGANSWVGNPGIKPEKHYQIDTGLSAGNGPWGVTGGIWYDRVDDFISRDTARGQAGILMSNGASIYRNVDAELAGVDLSGSYRFSENWKTNATASYTYGANLTDSRPLYQIAPLSGSLEVVYEQPVWQAGTRLRWAANQTRADTNPLTGSGLDAQETPGHVVLDLFASWKPVTGLELKGGVSNLLDQTYASYLSRSNGFDPAVVQVNEPGRSFYIQAALTF